VIEVCELHKFYGRKHVLGPVSLSVGKGEIVGLLGLNGAGKTTTLRILTGDLLPTSGQVLVDGLDVSRQPHAVRERIGYLPDVPPIYPEMTVREYLAFAAEMRGVPHAKRRARVDDAMTKTALSGVADDLIGALSLGYRQRVGVAQAIVHEPPCVILDEPIRGLDPEQIVEMRTLVRSLGGAHTVILSSHILSEVRETCERVFVIAQGRVVAEGTAAELGGTADVQRLRVLVLREAERGPEHVEQLLCRLPGVSSVTIELAPSNDTVLFETRSASDVRRAVCAELVQAGVPLLEVSSVEVGLEQAFLELVRAEGGAP
jgi:ABC-2 type transport system ATP-binding protein